MGRGGRDDLFELELTVVVAIIHVARHMRIAAVHVAEHALLGDEPRRFRKYGAALDVIPMTVAVDHIADRRVRKSLGELSLEPIGKIRVDGIDDDDALR